MESNQTPDTKVQPQAIYRAVGRIAGTYQPSAENFHNGQFVTPDGLSIPAKMTGRLRRYLSKKYPEYTNQPGFFQQLQMWTAYPKTEPLRFDLVTIKPLSPELLAMPKTNEFRLVGEIKSITEQNVVVRIKRNQPNYQGNKTHKFKSFRLTLEGNLPAESVGQLWQLEVQLEGASLVLIAGQRYEPSDEDKAWLTQNASKKALARAAKEAASKVADAKVKAADDESKANADNKAASESGVSIPQEEVAGKSQAIAIAEESSSMAAITTGQTDHPKKQLVSQPLTTTDAGTAPSKSGSKPKHKADATSHQAATIRPVQQRQQKTSISPSSQHSPDQPVPALKSSASGGKVKAQEKKPKFQVKVNDQVFSGYDSVTLNNRMLRIDGKAVAQAKMVVVIGQVQTMLADGKVTQKDNQAVLISR